MKTLVNLEEVDANGRCISVPFRIKKQIIMLTERIVKPTMCRDHKMAKHIVNISQHLWQGFYTCLTILWALDLKELTKRTSRLNHIFDCEHINLIY